MQKIKPEFQSFGAEVRRLRKAAGLNHELPPVPRTPDLS